MPQQVRRRKQGSINITAFGTKYVQPLGRGMILRESALRLSGSMTWASAANNNLATAARGDEWAAINRIDLIANGSDIIRSFSGPQLRMFNRLVYNSPGRLSAQYGDGSTASPTFDSTLILPLWQFLAARPMDTALDTSRLSDLRLEVTTETANGVQSAAAPTAIAATLDIETLESFGIEGVFSDCKIYPIQSSYSAANGAAQIQLPVSALYRGFFINTATSGASIGDDAANVITNVKLVSGTTVFYDCPWPILRDWQRQRTGMNRSLVQTTAGAATVNGNWLRAMRSARVDEDAWAFMDLCPDGYLTEGIDSVGLSELYLELNVASACTVTVLPVQIFPRRGAPGR